MVSELIIYFVLQESYHLLSKLSILHYDRPVSILIRERIYFISIGINGTHSRTTKLSCFSLISVDGGHRAVIFDRFTGIKKFVVGEGTHFFVPWVQKPIIFDIRSRPRNVPVITGSRGMQTI